LTLSDVQHVAKLANLPLTDKQLKTFQTQLSDIINYVNQLQEVGTTGVELTSQATGLTNVLREDKVTKSLTQAQALSNAPKTQNDYIQVPGILNET
jgi:aspartyl-tRNA(Asn)/glutamyl-tRNA(Gln) amidotransferase subunit C